MCVIFDLLDLDPIWIWIWNTAYRYLFVTTTVLIMDFPATVPYMGTLCCKLAMTYCNFVPVPVLSYSRQKKVFKNLKLKKTRDFNGARKKNSSRPALSFCPALTWTSLWMYVRIYHSLIWFVGCRNQFSAFPPGGPAQFINIITLNMEHNMCDR